MLATEFDGQLRSDGYRPGPPDHLTVASILIDAEVCGEAECPLCGARGLRHRPYHRGQSYKAVAVCPRCSFSEEF